MVCFPVDSFFISGRLDTLKPTANFSFLLHLLILFFRFPLRIVDVIVVEILSVSLGRTIQRIVVLIKLTYL